MNHLLEVLEDNFNEVERRLIKARELGNKKEQGIQTLRIIEILRKFKKIYDEFSDEDFGIDDPLKKTEELIKIYERDI